jgi:hypothetical protein
MQTLAVHVMLYRKHRRLYPEEEGCVGTTVAGLACQIPFPGCLETLIGVLATVSDRGHHQDAEDPGARAQRQALKGAGRRCDWEGTETVLADPAKARRDLGRTTTVVNVQPFDICTSAMRCAIEARLAVSSCRN